LERENFVDLGINLGANANERAHARWRGLAIPFPEGAIGVTTLSE
jgi:hypothetical protein